MDNIWDSDDEGQQQEDSVNNRNADNESEQDKPKILKRKDEKLLNNRSSFALLTLSEVSLSRLPQIKLRGPTHS